MGFPLKRKREAKRVDAEFLGTRRDASCRHQFPERWPSEATFSCQRDGVLRLPHSPAPLNRWINDPRSVCPYTTISGPRMLPRRCDARRRGTSSLRGIKGHVPTYGRVADVGSGNVKIHGRPGILTACRKFPSSRSRWNGARRAAGSSPPPPSSPGFFLAGLRD